MSKTNEIKTLLQNGKTVKEIVMLGYGKPLIYKCRKEIKDEPPIESDGQLSKKVESEELPINFHAESDDIPEKILDNNTVESNNPITSTLNNLETEPAETDESSLTNIDEEIFSDDDAPFRDFGGFAITRDDINITPINEISQPSISKESTKSEKPATGGQLGLTELLTEVFSTVGIVTGHEFWDLSTKDQKVLKHLCKLPGIERFLHKFGLYGCVFGLFTITFKRIKMEMADKKNTTDTPEIEMNPPLPLMVSGDIPTNILESVPQ